MTYFSGNLGNTIPPKHSPWKTFSGGFGRVNFMLSVSCLKFAFKFSANKNPSTYYFTYICVWLLRAMFLGTSALVLLAKIQSCKNILHPMTYFRKWHVSTKQDLNLGPKRQYSLLEWDISVVDHSATIAGYSIIFVYLEKFGCNCPCMTGIQFFPVTGNG